VVLKWLLEDPAREPDTEKALAFIESVVSGRLEVLQPVHWLTEVAAVAPAGNPPCYRDQSSFVRHAVSRSRARVRRRSAGDRRRSILRKCRAVRDDCRNARLGRRTLIAESVISQRFLIFRKH